MTGEAPHRLDRDRLTWLTYIQLGCFGWFLYGFGPSLSLLRDELDVSRAVAGLHGTALAAGALTSALVIAPLVRRFGRGPMIWAGLATLGVAVMVYTATPVLPLTLLGAFLGAFGGSFAVTAIPAVLTDRHGPGGASAVTEANAAAASIGLVAPLAIGASVALGLGWRPAVLLLVPALIVLAVVGRGVDVPAPVGDSISSTRGRLPSRYWVSWTVLTAGIGVEFCLTLWAADILRERAGLSAGAAAAGITAVVAGIAVGRLAGGRLALRYSTDGLLLGALVVTAAGFAVFWLTRDAVLAIPALGMCGLGIALFYPLGVVRAIHASEGRPDVASARAGLGAALASGAGPFVLGALADQVGIHRAFLVVPALLVVAAVAIVLSRPRTPR